MADFSTSAVRFDGLGATAGSAAEASRVLAERLNHWCADHPDCRIVDLRVQSTAVGSEIHLTAIIAYVAEDPLIAAAVRAAAAEQPPADLSVAVAQAEEIVSEAQQDTDA